MMRSKISILTGVAFAALTTAALSQNLNSSSGPAEIPPASYKGKQYVDSKGCIYIRAGQGKRIIWVPRVNRKRQLLCGYQPTLAKPANSG